MDVAMVAAMETAREAPVDVRPPHMIGAIAPSGQTGDTGETGEKGEHCCSQR